MGWSAAGVDAAVEEKVEKMRLLMESAPREHERRTLSAHLECRTCADPMRVQTSLRALRHLCATLVLYIIVYRKIWRMGLILNCFGHKAVLF